MVVGPRISLSESYKQLAELKKIDISEVKNNDDYEKLREKLTQYNAENKSKKIKVIINSHGFINEVSGKSGSLNLGKTIWQN